MLRRLGTRLACSALAIAGAQALAAQDAAPPGRTIEGQRIINLPSAEVPAAGTLGLLFTHRFAQPLHESDWHSLFSFDSGADIGIGLSYVLIRGLEISLDRSSIQDDWEFAAKYRFLARSERNPLSLALRAGGNARTAVGADRETGYFAQAIAAVSIGSRVRITLVPTYLSRTSGQRFVPPEEDVFNVPVAVAVGVTRSLNFQAELIPRRGRHGSPRTGWIAAVEKTVLRHRFAFTVGNVRTTTVDQYAAPDFFDAPEREDYFIGFNLVRQWKLK